MLELPKWPDYLPDSKSVQQTHPSRLLSNRRSSLDSCLAQADLAQGLESRVGLARSVGGHRNPACFELVSEINGSELIHAAPEVEEPYRLSHRYPTCPTRSLNLCWHLEGLMRSFGSEGRHEIAGLNNRRGGGAFIHVLQARLTALG